MQYGAYQGGHEFSSALGSIIFEECTLFSVTKINFNYARLAVRLKNIGCVSAMESKLSLRSTFTIFVS